MAWCAAARRDATPPAGPVSATVPRLQLESLRSCEEASNSIAIAVIDANALISFDSSARLLALACSSSPSLSPRFVTVKEVLEEVRAPASRFHLGALPCSLDCIDPSDEAMQKVVKFARETGDLASLSDVDLKLLALTYMIEEQTYGSAHLRTRPPPVHVAQVRHMRERDLPGWGANVQNLEEWEQLSQEQDNTTDEGSHILGLKNLSLNPTEQGNIVSEEKQKSAADQEVLTSAAQGEEECQSAARGEGQEFKRLEHLTPEAMYEEEKCEETFHYVQEDESQDGSDWQRAVSRSTRRKHEKRAAGAAMKSPSINKEEVQSMQGDQVRVMVSQAGDMGLDGIGNEDAEEMTLDESNDAEDTENFEEDCPSVSETSGAEERKDSESEASWALRPLSQSKVACITADFPMQNVLLQIGLRVVSPNGLQIQQLKRWALKCEACRNVTSDVGRIFCPKCGNGGTLYKVSITIGPNGVVHTGTRKRSNIRGTKYSLPLPKGGRQGATENPILREDQLPKKMLRPKKKVTIPDFTSPAELFVMKSGGKEKMEPPLREALAIFSGKRNPNRPRSKQRG